MGNQTSAESKSYRKLLPELLKKRGWSYAVLQRYTNKDRSYWNATVKGKKAIPGNAVLEDLARLFGVPPEQFQEYNKRLASEAVSGDIGLAMMVLEQRAPYGNMVKLKTPKAYVPIMGRVPAGNLREAFEQRIGEVPLVDNADFAVVAAGDCLIGALIGDGDIVYIKKQATANKGELVLARIDQEVTLKFYHPEKDKVILKCANPKHKDIVSVTVEIIGVKVAVLRR